jgi:hypothetical protein
VPSETPESEIFDNGAVQEIAVDGKSVARLEIIDDLSMSPVDDAALVTVLRVLSETLAEAFEEDSDVGIAEALERGNPEVRVADTEGWETLDLDGLIEEAREEI